MDRKKVLSKINIDTDIFLTSFDKASKLLIDKKIELESQGWSSVHLKMEYSYDHAELICIGMRLETDSEFNKRVKVEELKFKKQKAKEDRERKKLAELKAKYES